MSVRPGRHSRPWEKRCADERCEHPQGWHWHGVGSCLECACLGFATAGTAEPCHQDPVPAAVVDTPQGDG